MQAKILISIWLIELISLHIMSTKIWKCHTLMGGPLHYVPHLHKMKFVTIIAHGDCPITCTKGSTLETTHTTHWTRILISFTQLPFCSQPLQCIQRLCLHFVFTMVLQAVDLLLGPSSTGTVFLLSSKVFLIITTAIFLQNSSCGFCDWDLAWDQ